MEAEVAWIGTDLKIWTKILSKALGGKIYGFIWKIHAVLKDNYIY